MTSTNLGSLHSSCSSMDNKEDQHKLRLALSHQESYVKYYKEQYHQGCYHGEHHMLHQEKVEGVNSASGKEGNGLKVIICKKVANQVENQPENSSVRWMSSKMRMMKKMQNSGYTVKNSKQKFEDHKEASSSYETNNSSNYNSSLNTIRVCTDCNTTKTPLWRSGPQGPKSLCNACGIRQRKARRAMAAAAAASGTIPKAYNSPSMKSKVQHKYKKSSEGIIMPFKKRFKVKAPPKEKLKFNLSEHSGFQGVFYPQDEKEGAILLMALSHGLVQS